MTGVIFILGAIGHFNHVNMPEMSWWHICPKKNGIRFGKHMVKDEKVISGKLGFELLDSTNVPLN